MTDLQTRRLNEKIAFAEQYGATDVSLMLDDAKALADRIAELERQNVVLRDCVERCEVWVSTFPEGKAMRDVCRAAIGEAK